MGGQGDGSSKNSLKGSHIYTPSVLPFPRALSEDPFGGKSDFYNIGMYQEIGKSHRKIIPSGLESRLLSWIITMKFASCRQHKFIMVHTMQGNKQYKLFISENPRFD